ncbi:hypothetical protein BGW38_001367 [Lunasporangiospora selenospora]|uniref:GH16 domain-containing protein n=1 Tax=Lunasporangiospora selenospora TaxID=979761 RepID=A0A9P6G215_9FUNG|nr:hypothetical protein BGW38_001367 [Lunasporangiospora selenospora]
MNFDHPDSVVALANFSGNPTDAPWTSDFTPSNVRIENGSLILTLKPGHTVNRFGNKPGFGATVSSTRWMLYGTVTARIKAGSPGGGIVSSFIYRSSITGDEIDYEWVGKHPNEVQSNYYWRTLPTMDPKDIDYTHSRRMDVGINLSEEYQDYTIEWLPDRLTWYINGQEMRTILRSEVNETKYPSTPSQIQFSIWDGGLGEPETIEWAGGPTLWGGNQAPYEMFIDYVDVKCFSPIDPDTTPWPPKGKGFQNIVNPLAKDLKKAHDAIVLGENAPSFSVLERGGLHWGRFDASRNLAQTSAGHRGQKNEGVSVSLSEWCLCCTILWIGIFVLIPNYI